MHKCIRLTIVARYEAKALHRIEEFDRAGSLLPGQLALRRGRLSSNRDNIADNLKIGCRHLAAAINQIELELLAFSQAFEARTLNSADMDKHVLAAVFALNEAETLLGIEELDDTLTSADNLGRHPAATAAAGSTGAAEAAAAAWTAATEAAAIAAAGEAAAVTAAAETAAVAAAKAATTTAAAAAAKTAAIKSAAETSTAAAAVGIESTFVTETIALVASATPPPSVKTHKNQ
jgi:hypothetical protein